MTVTIVGQLSPGVKMIVELDHSHRRNPIVSWWQNLRRRHVIVVYPPSGSTTAEIICMVRDAVNARNLGLYAELRTDGTLEIR